MNKDSRQQKWPMSQFIFKRNNNIVQNSTLVQKKPIISSSTTQNLSPLIRQQQKRNSVIPATHYLTVSSEETEFTFTELDGEDLVDVDYISDYSVDLSNDEDDENFEDIQTELYLRNLLFTIDRLTFDDLSTVERQNVSSTSFSLIELPKNLVAECHVWRQKFRFKRSAQLSNQTNHRTAQHPTILETRQRYRRTSTETAAINKVIDWNVDNSLASSFPKLLSSTAVDSNISTSINLNSKPPLIKVGKKGVNGGWMQSGQPSASSISRITLPPIVNPKRPQSQTEQQQTAVNSINSNSSSHVTTTTAVLNKPIFELKPRETESRYSTVIKRQQVEQRQSSYQQHHPLQTSRSLNEEQQVEQYVGEEDVPKTTKGSTSGMSKGTSATSSYCRITLHDLLDQREAQQKSDISISSFAWGKEHHRQQQNRPSAQLRNTHQQQHLLKLPAIES